ncbi:hypothetical protein NAC44_08160 [Allorhizobium sp. BGMRC 0089]|uniref:hypothetical protein n=1 Tax=Allorhizobium sonneratiae TaxID=2934936 RepID=UPI002033F7EF|nr:hypothetical protein [Allorhizobium sonneratiae]MCM2292300.1 hypothetical protein [Allorhizobium sonneratiae]
MRNLDNSYFAALQNARESGIVPRKFVSFTVKDRDSGEQVTLGFWSGDEALTVTVPSGFSGEHVTRRFTGGVNLAVDTVPRVSDLSIQTVTVSLSQIAPEVQRLVRGYDVRLGKVEIYEAVFDPRNRTLVAMPPLVFLGQIDGAPITTPMIGAEGAVEIRVVSDAISMLTRKNPAKSSYETQKLRGGDEWGLYSAAVASWTIPWGQKKS